MIIITKTKLIAFYEKEPKAKEPLLLWYHSAKRSNWSNFSEVKNSFNSVDSVGNKRYVFNIGGNKYRLVVLMFFEVRTIYIRFVGTHQEYDKIKNVKTV